MSPNGDIFCALCFIENNVVEINIVVCYNMCVVECFDNGV